jgi:hypothetical protein
MVIDGPLWNDYDKPRDIYDEKLSVWKSKAPFNTREVARLKKGALSLAGEPLTYSCVFSQASYLHLSFQL